jgi:hypothetical protein
MWDYNVGLVRITPFFKSCNYSKVSASESPPEIICSMLNLCRPLQQECSTSTQA